MTLVASEVGSQNLRAIWVLNGVSGNEEIDPKKCSV